MFLIAVADKYEIGFFMGLDVPLTARASMAKRFLSRADAIKAREAIMKEWAEILVSPPTILDTEMYAVMYFGSSADASGFYVADDEPATKDLDKAVIYHTKEEAQIDAGHVCRTWEMGDAFVVKVG